MLALAASLLNMLLPGQLPQHSSVLSCAGSHITNMCVCADRTPLHAAGELLQRRSATGCGYAEARDRPSHHYEHGPTALCVLRRSGADRATPGVTTNLTPAATSMHCNINTVRTCVHCANVRVLRTYLMNGCRYGSEQPVAASVAPQVANAMLIVSRHSIWTPY